LIPSKWIIISAATLIFTLLALFANAAPTPIVTTNPATFVTDTSLTFNAAISPNNYFTHGWFEFGTTPSLGSSVGLQTVGNGLGTYNISYTVGGLNPSTTYYYRAVAQNTHGITYGSILSLVTRPGTGLTFSSSPLVPIVLTKNASFISSASALLNGEVNPRGAKTDVWFEWGTTPSLGNSTPRRSEGSGTDSSSYSFALTGLQPGTSYYFRAVAENAYGRNFGSIASFTTSGGSVEFLSPASVPLQTTSASVSQSRSTPSFADIDAKVFLQSSVDKDNPRQGEDLNLTLIVKNTSSVAIDEVMVKLTLPQEVEYQISNIPPREKTDFHLVFALGTIGSGGQSAINIRLKVREDTPVMSALVFNTALTYRDPADREHFLNSFLAAKVEKRAMDLALILSSGFMRWFLMILPLFIVMIIFGYFFLKKKQEEENKDEAVAR